MEVIEIKTLNEMWSDLVEELGKLPQEFNDLQKCYSSLLRFTSVLYSEKLRLMEVTAIIDEKPEDYRKEVRGFIVGGMHYEERKMMRLLKQPSDKKDAAFTKAEVEVMLEAAKRFENLLQSQWEVAKLDFYMSKKGHE